MAAARAAASAAFWASRWAAIRSPQSMTRPTIPSSIGKSSANITRIFPERSRPKMPRARRRMAGPRVENGHRRRRAEVDRLIAE
jgi:hypothetical protein